MFSLRPNGREPEGFLRRPSEEREPRQIGREMGRGMSIIESVDSHGNVMRRIVPQGGMGGFERGGRDQMLNFFRLLDLLAMRQRGAQDKGLT